MSLNHRASTVIQNDSGTNAAFGASYLVNVLPVGATCVTAASTASPTVRAGHGFQIGDVIAFGTGTTVYKTVTAVTATTISWSGAITVALGDLFVNLGPDSLSSGASYDGSRMDVFSDMDGTTAVTNAQITTDAQGNYDYYHEGSGHHWELVRDASGTPLLVVDGIGGGPLTPGDYGAYGDASDEVGQLQALLWAANGLNKPIVFPPAKTYWISTGIDCRSMTNIYIKGHNSTIKFQVVADLKDSGGSPSEVHTESIMWFKTSTDIEIDGLNFNGNLSNRTQYASGESFNDCITIDEACADVLIQNCFITEGMTDGIAVLIVSSGTAPARIQIINNRITKCRRNNITVSGGTDIDIIRNKIEDAGLSNTKGTSPKAGIGIEIEKAVSTGACDRVNVLNNKVTGSLGTYALYLNTHVAATDVEIAGNDVYSNPGSAGDVAEAGINCQYKSGGVTSGNTGCTVHHNRVHLNGKGGIRVVNDALESVKDNVIHTNAEYAIIWQSTVTSIMLVENNTIHSNGTGGTGLGIGVNNATVDGALIVKGNTFYNNDGLAAAGTMDIANSTFLFENNLIYDTQGTATQTLCSSNSSGSNARRIARGNIYRNLLTNTYVAFGQVSDDTEIGGVGETSNQAMFRGGISTGDGTDAGDITLLGVRRSSSDVALSWNETDDLFTFGDGVRIQSDMFVKGSFGDKVGIQVAAGTITITGDTNTESSVLPANSLILGVLARLTTAISGGTVTGWSLGDAAEVVRFSEINGTLTADETDVGTQQWDPSKTDAQGPVQVAAGDLTVNCDGSPTAGVVRYSIYYMQFTAPTS